MNYPYWLALLIALDRFAAVAVFNCPDMCVSSLCWVALVEIRWPPYCIDGADVQVAADALTVLKLSGWQLRVLVRLGRWLEAINPGHCRQSARDDGVQGARTMTLTTGIAPAKVLP
jgi:hypothetical protein